MVCDIPKSQIRVESASFQTELLERMGRSLLQPTKYWTSGYFVCSLMNSFTLLSRPTEPQVRQCSIRPSAPSTSQLPCCLAYWNPDLIKLTDYPRHLCGGAPMICLAQSSSPYLPTQIIVGEE